jgi:ubiquinone biosynthesis protein COQ9
MSHDEARDKILLAMMPHVIFDGWSRRSLAAGVEDAGYSPDMALRAFPGGLRHVAEHFASHMDQQMLTELTHYKLANMKIRERIATCVRVRLQLFTPFVRQFDGWCRSWPYPPMPRLRYAVRGGRVV